MTGLDRKTVKTAWLSLFVSVIVLALKYYAYVQTQSSAVLSDAVETIVNVVAATSALFILRAVAEPADEEHPYGHGKLEYFSAAFEGGLIAFAALVIGYEAVISLLAGGEVRQIDIGLFYIGIAALINWVMGWHLLRTGHRQKSEALIASGQHVMSDVVTTAGVFIGLVAVKFTGLQWIDPVVAILVALHLAKSGIQIVRRSVGGLIDEKEPASLAELAKIFNQIRQPGLIDMHKVKLIRSGNFHHIDGHMVVPEFWDVAYTHVKVDEFEKAVLKHYGHDGETAFHVDPCEQAYCSRCDLESCHIRQRPFQNTKTLTEADITGEPQKDRP